MFFTEYMHISSFWAKYMLYFVFVINAYQSEKLWCETRLFLPLCLYKLTKNTIMMKTCSKKSNIFTPLRGSTGQRSSWKQYNCSLLWGCFSESDCRAIIKSSLYNTWGLLPIVLIEYMHIYDTFDKIKFNIQRSDYRWPRPECQSSSGSTENPRSNSDGM